MGEPDVQLFAARAKKKLKQSHAGPTSRQQDSRKAEERRDRVRSGSEATQDGAFSHAEQATSFFQLGLREHLQRTCSALGMDTPTPVQKGVIPAVLARRDCIGVAQTGSGKTAAFALPIIDDLTSEPFGVHSLVLTPTRELAFQISEQFEALGKGASVRHMVVVGGMDQQDQAMRLRRRPHVVVATPGRLAELLRFANDLSSAFRRLRILVLDEADRILEPSFEMDLQTVLQMVPTQRQTLLFTATMTQDLEAVQRVLSDPFVFREYNGIAAADGLRENYVLVPARVREVYLCHLLALREEHSVRSTIVFCAKRKSCEAVSGLLYHLGVPAVSLHGGKQQKARLGALSQFKSGQSPILVATDVAARGLDIPTVDLVVNFELPRASEEYVHRAGRTARAGRGGWAVTLVTQYDVKLLQTIESVLGRQLPVLRIDEDEALKDISKVFTARRAALLAIERKKNLS